MRNTPKRKIIYLIIQVIIITAMLSAAVYYCFARDITSDSTSAVGALTIATICLGTYFLIKFHLLAEQALNQQKISSCWILIPLLLTGSYITATNILIQLTDDPEIIQQIQSVQPYQKETLTTFLIWLILVSVSIISTRTNSAKGDQIKTMEQKRNPRDKHLYHCTLKSKATGNVLHFQIVAWDEIQLLEYAQRRYRQMNPHDLVELVGEENVVLEPKHPLAPPSAKEYPDFSELEFKYIDRGRGTDEYFLPDDRWPEEIEADPESPYANLVKTL